MIYAERMVVLECLYKKAEIVVKIIRKKMFQLSFIFCIYAHKYFVFMLTNILYLCSQIFCIYAHKYFVFSTGGGGRLRKNKINNKFR